MLSWLLSISLGSSLGQTEMEAGLPLIQVCYDCCSQGTVGEERRNSGSRVALCLPEGAGRWGTMVDPSRTG